MSGLATRGPATRGPARSAQRTGRLVPALLAALLLAGCAAGDAERTAERAHSEAERHLATTAPAAGTLATVGNVQRMSGVWLGDRSRRLDPRDLLPGALEGPKGVTLALPPVGLEELAARIAEQSGLRVDLEGKPVQASGGSSDSEDFRVVYEGPLSGLLDMIAARYDLEWDYKPGRQEILLLASVTHTFRLETLPIGFTFGGSVTSGGSLGAAAAGAAGGTGSSGGSGSGSVSLQAQASVASWTQVTDTVRGLAGSGGEVAVSPATGDVVVTTTPSRMRRIAAYISQQNERRLTTVALQITIYSWQRDDRDAYGINLDALFQAAGLSVGLSSPASSLGEGLAQGSIAVIEQGALPGSLVGSQAVAQALSKAGEVGVVTSVTLVTPSDVPVPWQAGRDTAYLASVSQTDTANVGSSVSLEPGVVTDGLVLTALPRVLDDRRVSLALWLRETNLVSLNTISSGDASIQVPELDSRTMMQQAVVNSGATLVLAGFERARGTRDGAGVGHPALWPFGGSLDAQSSRESLVLVVTPMVRRSRVEETRR
ncbi:type IVB pilus formation outer membrane protein, R64 PilN family [Tistlia consotensis]|uniref:Type IVB pilus formation outer membrane protein, R64 PilN family n=1 Tax=Tistlia consotensis USBA 355 TaxID=560819 RepID=A0A1Y6BT38_9PROT|nr:hypothetical protein [Tistlia consotensis]SMF26958.1 type IVB pilus formation outer membrane protein, R64 PilN family [Tistlia consotensis USBA 355]SNR66646.1 type IVB pilus formation outer membrane protein, R64 PilN family [Tistlia consotensis]